MTRALAWAWFGALAGGAGAAFVMFLGECTPLGYSLRLESEEGPWFLRYVALGASIGGIVAYAVVRLRSLRERRDDCPETAPTGDAQSEGEEGE